MKKEKRSNALVDLAATDFWGDGRIYRGRFSAYKGQKNKFKNLQKRREGMKKVMKIIAWMLIGFFVAVFLFYSNDKGKEKVEFSGTFKDCNNYRPSSPYGNLAFSSKGGDTITLFGGEQAESPFFMIYGYHKELKCDLCGELISSGELILRVDYSGDKSHYCVECLLKLKKRR